MSREQIRSQNKADLQDIINNQELQDEQKQTAVNTMVSMTELTEKEAAAELLLEAKGISECSCEFDRRDGRYRGAGQSAFYEASVRRLRIL